jgi:nucleotide-binding universal stress UspA family protein
MPTEAHAAIDPQPDVSVARVMVPLDGGPEAEVAIDTAAAVAERLGATLTLFGWHWGSGAEWVARRYLERLRELRSLDCEVQGSWSDDDGVAEPLLRAAGEVEGTLVCMATHARGGIGEVLLGSVAEDVLRRTDQPVLLVGPRADGRPDLSRPVVVTLDGSERSEEAIPLGAAWARRLGVPLELVTVLEPNPADGHPWREGDVLESGYVAGLADRFGADSWEVLHGDHPASAVADHVSDRASLLVTSTHGRGGLARVVVGSVAMRIVHDAPCPVLVRRNPPV